MAHSLSAAPPNATPISTKSKKTTRRVPSLGFQRVWACNGDSKPVSNEKLICRRTGTLALGGVILGMSIGSRRANAARRPPAPPPEEKKDPNVSGVQAKVLASKKRKEAMKESMAKLRERGKPINEKPTIETPKTEPSQ